MCPQSSGLPSTCPLHQSPLSISVTHRRSPFPKDNSALLSARQVCRAITICFDVSPLTEEFFSIVFADVKELDDPPDPKVRGEVVVLSDPVSVDHVTLLVCSDETISLEDSPSNITIDCGGSGKVVDSVAPVPSGLSLGGEPVPASQRIGTSDDSETVSETAC